MVEGSKDKLAVAVSEYYFDGGFTQSEIAKKFGISRPRVSRLLQYARENGIVSIKVVDPSQHLQGLEKEICNLFNLHDCVVISTQLESQPVLYKKIGIAGSRYLTEKISDNSLLGIGRGRTVRESIINLKPSTQKNVKTICLTGGLGEFDANWQPNELCRIAAENFNGNCTYLYMQAVFDSKEIFETVKQDNSIRDALSLWDRLDWTIVGIGSVNYPINQRHEKAYKQISETLAVTDGSEPIGNCCHRLFDKMGRFCKTNLDERLVAISPHQLRKCPNVVAMAGGHYKVEALRGALQGDFINVLITDALTAEEIIRKEKEH
jgi:deoxyribonucleoside regulator